MTIIQWINIITKISVNLYVYFFNCIHKKKKSLFWGVSLRAEGYRFLP